MARCLNHVDWPMSSSAWPCRCSLRTVCPAAPPPTHTLQQWRCWEAARTGSSGLEGARPRSCVLSPFVHAVVAPSTVSSPLTFGVDTSRSVTSSPSWPSSFTPGVMGSRGRLGVCHEMVPPARRLLRMTIVACIGAVAAAHGLMQTRFWSLACGGRSREGWVGRCLLDKNTSCVVECWA